LICARQSLDEFCYLCPLYFENPTVNNTEVLNRALYGFKMFIRFFRTPFPENPKPVFWLELVGKKMLAIFLIMMLYFGLVDTNFLWLFGKSPSLDQLEKPQMDMASELYTADGFLIGKYYNENRTPVEYNQISPWIIKALVSTEDVRFYEHSGIDFRALPSVFIYNARGENRGGSTITQQLAKNLYKTREGGSKGLFGYIPGFNMIIDKTKEWLTAIKLERRFTKEDIITMYLNTVDFGGNAFGIHTAAKTFFNTDPQKLTIEESAMLVGLLKAPTSYSPVLHPQKAKERRNTVMAQMLKYHNITREAYDTLKNKPLALEYHVESSYDGPATYFRGIVNNYLKEWCKKNGYDLYTDGLKIYTTIDSRMQDYAEEAMQEHMSQLQKRFFDHWKGQNPWVDAKGHEMTGFIDSIARHLPIYTWLKKKYKNNEDSVFAAMNRPKDMTVFSWHGERDTALSSIDSLKYYKHFLHAGFMAEDPYTGQIKAWVGGINYKYFQYDHVWQSKRQPGSTFKPILYAAAFENGWGPCDKLKDTAVTIHYIEKGVKKTWSPHNSDYIFTGQEMTLRRGMGKSVNSIAAQVIEKIGWTTVIDYAHRLGIKSKLDTVPSVGLGSSDVSVYELVNAYCTFMNRGINTEPSYITKIIDRNGKVLHVFNPATKRAISEETAYLMTYMLKGGIEEPGGTSQALWAYDLFKGPGNEIGGKTGTSSHHSDGWFVGVTKDLVAGMWVGGDDRCIHFKTSAVGEGSRTALPMFGLFMEKVYADKSLGITMGYFPKPAIPITKPYNCRTVLPKDSIKAKSDSLKAIDEVEF
jgi:penicillin-binding protein 1A